MTETNVTTDTAEIINDDQTTEVETVEGAKEKATKTVKKTTKKKTATKKVKKKTAVRKGKTLVIVESPAKAKTINKYLGSKFIVKASMGHVRDLPGTVFGVDLENNFEPTYRVLSTRKKIVDELKKYAADATEIYLATDLDREGEAIAWHLAQALKIPEDKAKRVMFNEITKRAIEEAFEKPLTLDINKVNAQQARRILDRIVGYQLSPLLWKKIARNLSAGRVQSVAVRLIVERELEVEKFVTEEYWTISAIVHAGNDFDGAMSSYNAYIEEHKEQADPVVLKRIFRTHGLFKADLVKFDGERFKATNGEDSGSVLEHLKNAVYQITEIQKKQRKEKAPPPFTTATLQQQAATRLSFTTDRTMRIAQQLYEGVEMGSEGAVALITYMRTDSVNLAKEAISSVRQHITDNYGDEYLPEKPNFYAAGKRAQEAHEAIRATDVNNHPDVVKQYLSTDQFKLYNLIWRRLVACQMQPARWDITNATITATSDGHVGEFKAVGRILAFPGFLSLLPERLESADAELPMIEKDQGLGKINVDGQQHFTQPPPRFTEASLVRTLEAQGIGRPSTYANIISTIQDRNYVKKEEKKFFPTDLGKIVTEQLVKHFPKIMDVTFTSHMEGELDHVEEATADWVKVLHEFYDPFKTSLEAAGENMEKQVLESEYKCDKCQKPMVYKWTKNGRFLACSGYPDCSNSMSVDEDGKPKKREVKETDHKCPKCNKPLLLRESRFGKFLGCSGYPECKTTIPCNDEGDPLPKVKPEDLDIKCPECGKPMAAKRFRGRSFMGCTGYPDCKTTQPIPDGIAIDWPETKVEKTDIKCTKCGADMVIRRSRRGPFLGCSAYPKCRNIMKMPPEGDAAKKDEAKVDAATAEVKEDTAAADASVESATKTTDNTPIEPPF